MVPALCLSALLLGPATPSAADPEPHHFDAVRSRSKITLDGKMGESEIWREIAPDDEFTERQPNLGEPAPFRTTLRVAYDENYLYFFVEAFGEGKKDQIVRTLRRDSFGIFGDDSIAIKIDPHHDRRSAHTFATNSDGAQVDTMTLEDGRVSIREWDAVWSVETQKYDDHFSAEFRIPFAVLGIKDGESLTMGLDISRDHNRRNATYDWRLIVPPRHPVSASAFGTLGNIRDIKAGRALEITPYAVARTDFTDKFTVDPRRIPNLSTGADARIQVGAGSYVEASILTDFAQVEADEVQVARDRFPLFFPERRPFFINGLDVFNFGQPRQGQLFFSRRIGLDGGRPVPVAAGAKAYGRYGPVSYGLLHVQTLRSLPDLEEDPDAEEIPAESYTVARLRTQAGPLTIGTMALGKHRFAEENADSAAGGVDFDLRSKNGRARAYGFYANSWFADPGTEDEFDDESGALVSRGEAPSQSQGNSAFLLAEYQGLYLRPRANVLWSDEDFQAPMGFWRRPGTAIHNAWFDVAPRPRFAGLREVIFGPRTTIVTDPQYSEVLTREYGSNIEFKWNAGYEIKYEVRHRVDTVQEAFDLYLYTIDEDRYVGSRHEFEIETPRRAAVSTELNYQRIEAFNGVTHQMRGRLQVRAHKHFSFGGTYTHLLGHLEDRDEDFNFGFANGNVEVPINRNLIWDNLVRLNLAPGAERFGLQSRVRWRYMPGSDIFLVYRSDIPLGLDPAGETTREPFHELTLKVTFYFRSLLGKKRAKRRTQQERAAATPS